MAFEYRFKPSPEELSEEKRARFQSRFLEIKESLIPKYETLVKTGKMELEDALEAHFREILSILAREFYLTLLIHK